MIDEKMIAEIASPAEFQEAFNTVRTNLYYALSGKKSKIVAVTGVKKGDGAGTVGLNTALAFSQIDNNRVLLIDADMRFSSLTGKLELSDAPGLSDCLSGKAELAKCAVTLGGIKVLPAGSKPSNPANLLESSAMDKLCTECRESFDYIFIVLPPAELFADTAITAKYVDGFVPVVRNNYTRFADAKRLVRTIRQTGAEILGFVYNRAHTKNKLK